MTRRHAVLLLLLACLPFQSAIAQTAKPAPAPAVTAPTPAAPASTAPAASGRSGVAGDHNVLLSDRIPPEQQVQLQAGDDQFAARYIADLSPEHRGIVIVLHDSGQHRSWPYTVAALLDELPLHGWSTLALELPAPALDKPPATAPAVATPVAAAAAPTAAAPQAQTLLTGSEAGAEKQAQARIDAALAKLVELNGGAAQPTIVIGFGSGAWRSAEFARRLAEGNGARLPEPVRALVLVDARNQLPAATVDLPKLLPTTALPTFDIVQNSEALTLADREARRRAVLHQKERIYQQLLLPPLNASNREEQTVLIKRIRSWVQRYVPPEEKSPANPLTAK